MPNAQTYTDKKQGFSIKYEIDDRNREISYTVQDKNDTYYFSLLDAGLLIINKNDKPFVDLRLELDEAFPRYDAEQHQYVSSQKYLRVTDMQALMDAYERIKNQNFSTRNISKGVTIKRATAFMDKYIFFTPESREILNEYLTRMRPDDYKRQLDKNAKYKKAITKTLEKEKNKKTRGLLGRLGVSKLFGK